MVAVTFVSPQKVSVYLANNAEEAMTELHRWFVDYCRGKEDELEYGFDPANASVEDMSEVYAGCCRGYFISMVEPHPVTDIA